MKTWNEILKQEEQKPYFHFLQEFVDKEYKQYTCYPENKIYLMP